MRPIVTFDCNFFVVNTAETKTNRDEESPHWFSFIIDSLLLLKDTGGHNSKGFLPAAGLTVIIFLT
jgi:hypothetical protein